MSARDDFSIKTDIVDALEGIRDPQQGDKSLVELGMVDKVEVDAGAVRVTVTFADNRPASERHALEDRIYDAIEAVEGVVDADVLPQTKSGPQTSASAAPPPPRRGLRIHGGGGGGGGGAAPAAGPAPGGGGGAQARPGAGPGQQRALEGVGQVIAVASGKGGVGKSTVAVNLALALAKLGHNVGLLDIDIYGPSLPTLLGIKERPAVRERRIVPIEAAGLRLMSLGFLMEEDTPVIWRGPIVTGIIRQFLQDVDWTGVDYLIVDMPPGTGDAQLSLAQTVPVDGALVVTTPSDLALIDAARGLQMFRTLDVDVIGLVENMSYHVWPGLERAREVLSALREEGKASSAQLDALAQVLDENGKLHLFGEGGGKREAERLGIPLLGEIPLDGRIRAGGDSGEPIVLGDPDSAVAASFLALAKRVTDIKPLGDGESRKGVFSFMKS